MESSQSVLSSDHRNGRDFGGLPRAVADSLSRLRHGSSDQRIGIVPEDSAGLRPVEPSIHGSASRRPRGFKNDQFASDTPSFGRRIFRSVTRFLIAALIGAGVTLTWQSDEAKEMVRARVPSLAWLLPVSTTKSSPTGQVTPVATITSPERVRLTQDVDNFPDVLAQQLKPMAINLALVRRSVEELAAQLKQMAPSLTTLQAVEQDKMSSPPSSGAGKNATRVAAPQAPSSPPSRAVPMSARNIVPSVAAPQPSAQSSFQSSSVSPPPPPGQPYLPELDLGPPHAK